MGRVRSGRSRDGRGRVYGRSQLQRCRAEVDVAHAAADGRLGCERATPPQHGDDESGEQQCGNARADGDAGNCAGRQFVIVVFVV